MGQMRQKSVPMTQAQLLEVLDDIRVKVALGDSYEGNLEYLMAIDDDGELIEGADFLVRAGYRTGNLDGQGGFRLIGGYEEVADGPSSGA